MTQKLHVLISFFSDKSISIPVFLWLLFKRRGEKSPTSLLADSPFLCAVFYNLSWFPANTLLFFLYFVSFNHLRNLTQCPSLWITGYSSFIYISQEERGEARNLFSSVGSCPDNMTSFSPSHFLDCYSILSLILKHNFYVTTGRSLKKLSYY